MFEIKKSDTKTLVNSGVYVPIPQNASAMEKRACCLLEDLLAEGEFRFSTRKEVGFDPEFVPYSFRVELAPEEIYLTHLIGEGKAADVESFTHLYHYLETEREREALVTALDRLLQTQHVCCTPANGLWLAESTHAWTGFTWACDLA